MKEETSKLNVSSEKHTWKRCLPYAVGWLDCIEGLQMIIELANELSTYQLFHQAFFLEWPLEWPSKASSASVNMKLLLLGVKK